MFLCVFWRLSALKRAVLRHQGRADSGLSLDQFPFSSFVPTSIFFKQHSDPEWLQWLERKRGRYYCRRGGFPADRRVSNTPQSSNSPAPPPLFSIQYIPLACLPRSPSQLRTRLPWQPGECSLLRPVGGMFALRSPRSLRCWW